MKHRALAVFIAAFLFGISAALFGSEVGLALTPTDLLRWGLMSLVVINIFMFVCNLIPAMHSMSNKSEEEIENIVAPALQGESNMLQTRTIKIFRMLAVAAVGILVGGIVLILMKQFVRL